MSLVLQYVRVVQLLVLWWGEERLRIRIADLTLYQDNEDEGGLGNIKDEVPV